MNNHYNKQLRDYAHELRTETVSRAEKFLWKAVLSNNKQRVKFKRQRPIYRFIVDFFSQEIGLIIEIDGNSHYHKPEYDAYRHSKLESLGYHILRFKEGEVLNDLNEVAERITHAIHCLRK
jgi:very-short-patch-repair endonuclease